MKGRTSHPTLPRFGQRIQKGKEFRVHLRKIETLDFIGMLHISLRPALRRQVFAPVGGNQETDGGAVEFQMRLKRIMLG